MEHDYKTKYINCKKMYMKINNIDGNINENENLTNDEYKAKYYKYKYKLLQTNSLQNINMNGGRLGVYEKPKQEQPKKESTTWSCNIL